MKLGEIFQNIGIFFANRSYAKKIAKMKHDDEIFIVLAPKFGDLIYGMMYARELKKERGKKLAVLCPEQFAKFVESYGCVDRIITVPNTKKYANKHFLLLGMRHTFLRDKYKYSDLVYTLPQEKYYKGLMINEIYRDYIFCIDHDNKQFLDLPETKVTAIQNFEEIKDRIIVMNPYAKSHAKNCVKILQPVADMLVKEGFVVYTNVIGDQKVLDGTLPLKCSIEELFEICKHIHGLVSIRSGLVDFCLNTKCKKVVVYMKKKRLRFTHSLRCFNDNIVEYFVHDKKGADNVIKIVKDVMVCRD